MNHSKKKNGGSKGERARATNDEAAANRKFKSFPHEKAVQRNEAVATRLKMEKKKAEFAELLSDATQGYDDIEVQMETGMESGFVGRPPPRRRPPTLMSRTPILRR